ncbi:sugar ABC transporter permease [Streptomyces sp. NPDC001508]|uniref:carbohydrate ABC transporter permease n=1 Tax=Streptomyces sp. NPDC001508 TaxID=3154656 RepID=UPI00331F9686
MLLLTLFVLLPVGIVTVLSLFHYDLLAQSHGYVGLGNVRTALRGGQLLPALWHTVLYWLITAPIIVCVGLLVAVAVNSLGTGAGLWRTAYFMPAASTLAAMSVIWTWMFYPNSGVIDSTLGRAIGVTGWLGSTSWALPAVAVVGAWHDIGSSMIMFLAGLNNVNPDLMEAARLDRAGAWQRFWHVSFPALGPSLVFAAAVATRNALSVFDQIQVMTAGGPARASTTLSVLMWQQAITFGNLGVGSVISVLLLLLVLAATFAQLRGFGRRWERAGTR